MTLRQITSIVTIALGALMIVAAAATWILVGNTLAAQNITVSEDAAMFAGDDVDGPLTAYAEAQVIDDHALEATGGATYAELDREDPLREVAMNASFLRASLFTSVLAFGVSAMAAAGGLMFMLIGLGIRDVETRTVDLTGSSTTAAPA